MTRSVETRLSKLEGAAGPDVKRMSDAEIALRMRDLIATIISSGELHDPDYAELVRKCALLDHIPGAAVLPISVVAESYRAQLTDEAGALH